jgi:hypothetical protein
LCFITYGEVNHERLWQPFHKHHRFRMLIHPKNPIKNVDRWEVCPLVETSWCGYGLVEAELQLLRTALARFPESTHFCVVCGATVPLHSPSDLLRRLSDTSTYLYACGYPQDNEVCANGFPYVCHSQWKTLTRRHAETAIRLLDLSDDEAQRFLKGILSFYSEQKSKGAWLAGCPDEFVIGSWLRTQHPKELQDVASTFFRFPAANTPHPIWIDTATLKEVDEIREHSLFMRKVAPDAQKVAELISRIINA